MMEAFFPQVQVVGTMEMTAPADELQLKEGRRRLDVALRVEGWRFAAQKQAHLTSKLEANCASREPMPQDEQRHLATMGKL